MVEVPGSSESSGACAFAVFASMTAAGRLAGDQATRLIGHVRILLIGGGVCACAIVAMLAAASPTFSFVALAHTGVDAATVIGASGRHRVVL